ncbi:MAG: hypothetical protein J3K34DRAFT_440644 [Monoraphidium minutum]|nr:MAG: hypothetical protein J3K34DRAFT_440644 [Monoraphidium minutum]
MAAPSIAQRVHSARVQQSLGLSRRPCVRASAAAQRAQQRRAAPRCAAADHAQRAPQQQPLDAPMFWARAYLLQQRGQEHQQREQRQAACSTSGSGGGLTATGACGAVALGAALLALLPPDAAHAAAAGGDVHAHLNASFDVSEGGEEFWGNIARYGRYFVTVMLGTGYVMVRPIIGLFKNPVTGVLAVAAMAGAAYGVKVTLEAMLGLSEPFDYLPMQDF